MANPTRFDIIITEYPPYPNPLPPTLPNLNINKFPCFLSRRQVFSNGIEANMGEGFLNRFLEKLQMTQLFLTINNSFSYQKPDKYFDVFLTVYEIVNSNQGNNIVKAGVAGLTLGLSTFVLRGKVDFITDHSVTVQRSDGQTRNYRARTSATCNVGAFANGHMAGTQMGGLATNLALTSISNQLCLDREFYSF